MTRSHCLSPLDMTVVAAGVVAIACKLVVRKGRLDPPIGVVTRIGDANDRRAPDEGALMCISLRNAIAVLDHVDGHAHVRRYASHAKARVPRDDLVARGARGTR